VKIPLFILLMDFVMSEDPIIDKDEYASLNDLLDRVARNYGYTDRISAWHANCFGKDIQGIMPAITPRV